MQPVIHRILAPIEFAELTEPEVDYAISVAGQLDATLLLFGVIDRATMLTLIGKAHGAAAAARAADKRSAERKPDHETFHGTMVGQASQILQGIVDRAAELGVEARGHVIVSESVADQILEEAKRQNADLILIHAKPRSLVSRALFGNTVEDVLHDAPCPVLVSNA
jgi:nucleotide-binding universal stress UspA family protein